jgi:hypothetical protein
MGKRKRCLQLALYKKSVHYIINKGNNKITELRTILQRESQNSKNIFFINVWRKRVFDINLTEYGTALTTVLPILFLYLNIVIVTVGTFEP